MQKNLFAPQRKIAQRRAHPQRQQQASFRGGRNLDTEQRRADSPSRTQRTGFECLQGDSCVGSGLLFKLDVVESDIDNDDGASSSSSVTPTKEICGILTNQHVLDEDSLQHNGTTLGIRISNRGRADFVSRV